VGCGSLFGLVVVVAACMGVLGGMGAKPSSPQMAVVVQPETSPEAAPLVDVPGTMPAAEKPSAKPTADELQARERQNELEAKEQREHEKARQADIETDHEAILRFIKKSVTDVKLEDLVWSGPSKGRTDKQRGRLNRLDCRYRVFSRGMVAVTYQFCLVDDAVTSWQRGEEEWKTVELGK
jgi:hypothetical protein